MAGPTLNLDVWRLIFEASTTKDLSILCLVSKKFKFIATPVLYRSIELLPGKQHASIDSDSELPKGRWLLLSRLEDGANDLLRAWVQEVTISYPPDFLDHEFLRKLESNDRLAKLIARLPNFRRFSIGVTSLQSDKVIRTICDHAKKPELLLFNQDGEMQDGGFYNRSFPCVSTLHARVNPWDEGGGPNRGPNRTVPAIQKLEEKFPPLESLQFSGYKMEDEEWMGWRDGLRWDRLSSLSVGPDNCIDVLGRLAGYATSLTTLKVSKWELDHLDDHCPKLRSLQLGINRVKGQFPEAVLDKIATGFKSLKNLSLHFELGLSDMNHPIKPTINYTSVRNIGQKFFNRRKQSGIDVPEWFTLTIWTGSYFRRWAYWEPPLPGLKYELRLPSDPTGEISFRHLDGEKLDMVLAGKIKINPLEETCLRKKVQRVVDGPREDDPMTEDDL
ncbi:hypothetical protein BO71DRAFT_487074 [Aspergillus ellipticus CBS 707.79]|uniref:F-box domain-containing protein n=1 Tax=Aspergillus ellipticus CBS 707.79 TaxID=1448320 RepID=A0A319DQV3_9EURO|nr:hypothetical protein BO71DRAFT_487074 [Aspergillus ellipticus CBS 707.79]